MTDRPDGDDEVTEVRTGESLVPLVIHTAEPDKVRHIAAAALNSNSPPLLDPAVLINLAKPPPWAAAAADGARRLAELAEAEGAATEFEDAVTPYLNRAIEHALAHRSQEPEPGYDEAERAREYFAPPRPAPPAGGILVLPTDAAASPQRASCGCPDACVGGFPHLTAHLENR